jgi:hypothetical protein
VLDHEHRVARVDEPLQRLEQLLESAKRRPVVGLVEDVERLAGRDLGQLRSKRYALRLAARQRRRLDALWRKCVVRLAPSRRHRESAYGYTLDGFAKPELGAPGRYMIEPIAAGATLFADYPGHKVKSGIELSGTSFSAPVVSGMAADLLATYPAWTPDQVKGALMLSATKLTAMAPNSVGVGEANVQKALAVTSPPNANLALNGFLIPDPSGGTVPVFNGSAWSTTVAGNAAWASAAWSSAAWSSAAWSSAAWSSAVWSSAAWSSAAWSSSAIQDNATADGLGNG